LGAGVCAADFLPLRFGIFQKFIKFNFFIQIFTIFMPRQKNKQK
jgi:hypothetical protein